MTSERLFVKNVEGWIEYYNQKDESITNPIQLVEYCVNGEPLTEREYRDAILEPTMRLLELERHHRFLDVGCGTGLFLREVEKCVDYCVGVDISKRLLDGKQCTSETFVCAAHELPFEDESFDRILIYSVAPCMPSFEYLKTVADKMLKILKLNGILLIGDVPIGNGLSRNYTSYNAMDIIEYLESIKYPYSVMAQNKKKRSINARKNILVYKE
jgi:ubiquinone/menaquinone biosynthesis C-methylase UbiE